MPLTLTEVRPGPAQSPEDVAVPCPLRRVLVTLRFRNANAADKPALEAQQVEIAIGGESLDAVATDANGDITLEYRGDEGALPRDAATVTWTANGRVGNFSLSDAVGQAKEAKLEIYLLEVDVAGTFTLKVDVDARRPWDDAGTEGEKWLGLPDTTGTLRWTDAAGTVRTAPIACAIDASPYFTQADLPCGTEITIEGLLPGAIGGDVALNIDGAEGWLAASDEDAESEAVTYRSAPHEDSVCAVVRVERPNTVVWVHIRHRFPKVMIVGEGTYFEYAVGLAEKYGNARGGLAWVYASQYDVTPVDELPHNHVGIHPTDGRDTPYDLHARVENACASNLMILHGPDNDDNGNEGRFDATKAAHWQHVLDTYGEFESVIFNNPHPGYGLHECVVFGLKTGRRALDKGRYISVQTIGYNVPGPAVISDDDWTRLLLGIRNQRFDEHRQIVRTGLGHRNVPTATVLAFTPGGVAAPVPIHRAFTYYNDDVIAANPPDAPAYYGGAQEFGNRDRDHYKCVVNTLGLHTTVIRSYRRYGPTVLVSGGELFIHGSKAYDEELTKPVMNGLDRLADAMELGVQWQANGNDRFFVRYPTNFTSSRFHPSHFTKSYKPFHEPSLDTALMYRWRKP